MANYIVTDTELIGIADAIRTKSGTNSSLVFPDGFVSAVGAIGGGGSNDFSTAEVTITYTGSDTIGFLGWWPFIADDRLGVGIGGNNEGSLTVDFLLYKNQPAVINFTDAGGCTYFYPYDAITVSGNATVDEYGDVTITGECTISLDGSEVEPM